MPYLIARYRGECSSPACDRSIMPGERIWWETDDRSARGRITMHEECKRREDEKAGEARKAER